MVGERHVNQLHKIRDLPKFFLFMGAAAVLLSAGPASAAEKSRQGENIQRDTYHRNAAKLETNRLQTSSNRC